MSDNRKAREEKLIIIAITISAVVGSIFAITAALPKEENDNVKTHQERERNPVWHDQEGTD